MPTDSNKPEVDVARVAKLARLDVSEADIGRLSRELDAVLAYAGKLGSLDLSAVEPLSHAAELECPLADDAPGGELAREHLERIAPSMDGPFIVVPKVLGGGG